MEKTDIVCFMFSSSQKAIQDKIATKLRKTYNLIKVNVNGKWSTSTDMIKESDMSKYKVRFPDAQLRAKGEYSEMNYQKGGIS